MKNNSSPISTIFFLLILSSFFLLTGCSDDGSSTADDPSSITSMVKTELMPGGTIVRRKCGNCHFLDKKMRKVGPGLAGIYMSKPKSKGLPFDVWDEQALDAWLADPIAIKPKTPMAISGLRDPEVRAQVIAYLKKL